MIVTSLRVEDEPRTRPITANAEPGVIQPGLPWSMAQHGTDRIGLRAVGLLRNERAVTALFRFEHGPESELGAITSRDPNPRSEAA